MAYALIFLEQPVEITIAGTTYFKGERIAAVSNNLMDIEGPFKWIEIPSLLNLDTIFQYWAYSSDGTFVDLNEVYEKYGVPFNQNVYQCPTCPE